MSSLKILSIKKSAEFKKLSSPSNKNIDRFFSKTLILLSKPTSNLYYQNLAKGQNANDFCRIGYTVSKKVGNAVIRNRSKRRLRAAFKTLASQYAKNRYDYVIIAKKEMGAADFEKIFSDLKFCLKRIHNKKQS